MADDGNDISLPKATITKLVKEYMPSDLRTAADTTEKLLECCTEFVNVVSAQANEIATADKKSTITPEHVLRSLEVLGFGGYCEDVRQAWEAHKEESKNTPKLGRRTMAEEAGLSEQEQIRMQQELFAQARARSMSLSEAQEASVRAQFEKQQQQQAGTPPPQPGSMPPPAPPAHVGEMPPPPQRQQQQQQQQPPPQQQPQHQQEAVVEDTEMAPPPPGEEF